MSVIDRIMGRAPVPAIYSELACARLVREATPDLIPLDANQALGMMAEHGDLALRITPARPLKSEKAVSPYLKEWQNSSSADPAQIAEWAKARPNSTWCWHLHDECPLVVVDVDTKHLPADAAHPDAKEAAYWISQLHQTSEWVFRTKSGGLHFWYRQPAGFPQKRQTPALPFAAGGGIDVLPSGAAGAYPIHPLGNLKAPLPELPEFVLHWIAQNTATGGGTFPFSHCKTTRDILAKYVQATPGQRNEQTMQAALAITLNGGSDKSISMLHKAAEGLFAGQAAPNEIDTAIASGRKIAAGIMAKNAEQAEVSKDLPRAVEILGDAHPHYHDGIWRIFTENDGWRRDTKLPVWNAIREQIGERIAGLAGNPPQPPAIVRRTHAEYAIAEAASASMSRLSDWDCSDRWIADCNGNLIDTGLTEVSGKFIRRPSHDILVSMRLGFDATADVAKADIEKAYGLLQGWANNKADGWTQFWAERAAYMLKPRNYLNALFVDIGVGANGKSTSNDFLVSLFGDYGMSGEAKQWRMGNDNEESLLMHGMMGKRICLLSELPTGALNSSFMKRLTGNATAQVRALYGMPVSNVPITITPLIETNSIPNFTDASRAMERRFRGLPYDNTFSDAAAGRAVSQWLGTPEARNAFGRIILAGLAALNKRGHLHQCDRVDACSSRICYENKPSLIQYIRDFMEELEGDAGRQAATTISEIRKRYNAEMNGQGDSKMQISTQRVRAILEQAMPERLRDPADQSLPYIEPHTKQRMVWGLKFAPNGNGTSQADIDAGI